MTTITMPFRSGASLHLETSRAGQVLLGIRDRLARRIEIARDRRALHALPDHMLRDMGLYRCEIERVTEYGRFA